jgi:hypothetical protein
MMPQRPSRRNYKPTTTSHSTTLTLLAPLGPLHQRSPQHQALTQEASQDASESENEDDVLPSYYNGRWYHNGQWHKLKEERPETQEELLEEIERGEKQIREEMEGEAAQVATPSSLCFQ